MLQPKQTKFRKMHKGRNRGLAQNGNTIAFGRFGLVASDRGRITARQIEAARRAMTRYCLLYTSPSPRDLAQSRMPSSA